MSELTDKVNPVNDFDWDAYENGDVLTNISKEELESKYSKTLNVVKDKDVVMGTVISMNKREVVVNVGYKSDGVVSMNEFRYNPELKVGDEVEAFVVRVSDVEGEVTLSMKKLLTMKGAKEVEDASLAQILDLGLDFIGEEEKFSGGMKVKVRPLNVLIFVFWFAGSFGIGYLKRKRRESKLLKELKKQNQHK